MAREFEDSEDASDPEDLHDAADVVEAAGAGVGLDEEHGDEVGQDGEHVDHVHAAADELPLFGSACNRPYVRGGLPYWYKTSA